MNTKAFPPVSLKVIKVGFMWRRIRLRIRLRITNSGWDKSEDLDADGEECGIKNNDW